MLLKDLNGESQSMETLLIDRLKYFFFCMNIINMDIMLGAVLLLHQLNIDFYPFVINKES